MFQVNAVKNNLICISREFDSNRAWPEGIAKTISPRYLPGYFFFKDFFKDKIIHCCPCVEGTLQSCAVNPFVVRLWFDPLKRVSNTLWGL